MLIFIGFMAHVLFPIIPIVFSCNNEVTFDYHISVLIMIVSYIPFSTLIINPTVLFSRFFFSKKLPIVVVRDVCPSVRPSVCPSVRLSVRLSSVEIFSFRGNSLSSKPIDLKIGLNVREGVVHVQMAWFFEILIAKLQIASICNFLQINLCARFWQIY